MGDLHPQKKKLKKKFGMKRRPPPEKLKEKKNWGGRLTTPKNFLKKIGGGKLPPPQKKNWGGVTYTPIKIEEEKISKSKKKKIFKSVHKQRKYNFVVQRVIGGIVQYRIRNPHQIFKSKKKKIIEIGPESTKLCFN